MEFSFLRFFLYLRVLVVTRMKEAVIQYSLICVSFIVIITLLKLSQTTGVFSLFLPRVTQFLSSLLEFIYLVTALVLVGKSFSNFHKKSLSFYSMNIPASTQEKYLATLVFSYVLNIIFVLIIFFIAIIISRSIVGGRVGFISDTGILLKESFQLWGNFSVFFMYFFAGAVFFKRGWFFKTVFSLVLLSIIITLVLMFVAYFLSLRESGSIHFSVEFLSLHSKVVNWSVVVFGVFLLFLAYIKFKGLQHI